MCVDEPRIGDEGFHIFLGLVWLGKIDAAYVEHFYPARSVSGNQTVILDRNGHSCKLIASETIHMIGIHLEDRRLKRYQVIQVPETQVLVGWLRKEETSLLKNDKTIDGLRVSDMVITGAGGIPLMQFVAWERRLEIPANDCTIDTSSED